MTFFEFIVEGPAVSLKAKKTNSKRYQKWIRAVRAVAAREWPTDKNPTNSRKVGFKITNYYTLSPPDVDNIIKPLMDALETVAYVNDQQVYKVTCEKFDLTNVSTIHNPSALLAAGLEKYSELLHIVVEWNEEE